MLLKHTTSVLYDVHTVEQMTGHAGVDVRANAVLRESQHPEFYQGIEKGTFEMLIELRASRARRRADRSRGRAVRRLSEGTLGKNNESNELIRAETTS